MNNQVVLADRRLGDDIVTVLIGAAADQRVFQVDVGYKIIKQELDLVTDEQVTLNFRLDPQDIQLERVVVTADALPTIEKLFEAPISKIDLSAKQITQIPHVRFSNLWDLVYLLRREIDFRNRIFEQSFDRW